MSNYSLAQSKITFDVKTDQAKGSGKGIEIAIGELILIKDAIYKLDSCSSISFQRFSPTLFAQKSVSLSFHVEGKDVISREIPVQNLSSFQLTGWKVQVQKEESAQKSFLSFQKE